MRLPRQRPAVRRRDPFVAAARGRDVAQALEAGEGEGRDPVVERIGGHAGDPGVARDVLDPREVVLRRRGRRGEIHVDRVHRPLVADVEPDGHRHAGVRRVSAELRQDVEDVVVGAPVLELRRHVDAGARLRLASSAASARAASATAAAAPAGAAASAGRGRREVVRDAQVDRVARRGDRVGVMEVLGRPVEIGQRDEAQQRQRRGADAAHRNLVVDEGLLGDGIDQLHADRREVTRAERRRRNRGQLIEQVAAAIPVVGQDEIGLARAVVDAADLHGAADGPAVGVLRIRLLAGDRVGAELVRRAVEDRSAERVVGRAAVAVLLAAAAAEEESAAVSAASAPRRSATGPAASARVRRARPVRRARQARRVRRSPAEPPRPCPSAPARRAKPAPKSPLAGSKTPRPIASKRSCIMPRSRLALLPVMAIASPELSGEKARRQQRLHGGGFGLRRDRLLSPSRCRPAAASNA